jgi:hypothetical protein
MVLRIRLFYVFYYLKNKITFLCARYNYTYGDIDDSIESITHLPTLQVAAYADAGVHDDDHQCLCPWPRCRCMC